MELVVKFKGVDGQWRGLCEDRWDGISKASEVLGIKGMFTKTFLSSIAEVRKVEDKRFREFSPTTPPGMEAIGKAVEGEVGKKNKGRKS